jgi:hypothetical protein
MIISLVMPEAPERLRRARETELRPPHDHDVREEHPEKRDENLHSPN